MEIEKKKIYMTTQVAQYTFRPAVQAILLIYSWWRYDTNKHSNSPKAVKNTARQFNM